MLLKSSWQSADAVIQCLVQAGVSHKCFIARNIKHNKDFFIEA